MSWRKHATQTARTPLTDATPPTGKIYLFSKIAIPFEPILQFDVLCDLEWGDNIHSNIQKDIATLWLTLPSHWKSRIQETLNLSTCVHNNTGCKTQRNKQKGILKNVMCHVSFCNVSLVTCHMSYVMCHVSCVIRHALFVTCHKSQQPQPQILPMVITQQAGM